MRRLSLRMAALFFSCGNPGSSGNPLLGTWTGQPGGLIDELWLLGNNDILTITLTTYGGLSAFTGSKTFQYTVAGKALTITAANGNVSGYTFSFSGNSLTLPVPNVGVVTYTRQ